MKANLRHLGEIPHIVKRALALLALAPVSLVAQPPVARPVNPVLEQDAGNDLYLRGKLLYDDAQKSADAQTRMMQYQRAAQVFNEYLNEFSEHPNAEPAWLYLGYSYYQSGQIDQAKRCFHTLLNRYGTGIYAAAGAYTLAIDHYNKGEYAFAAPLFERYATNAAKPEDAPRGFYFAGSCYRLLDRDREAIGSFQKVIDSRASGLYIAQSKLALGHIAYKAGKFQDALKHFESVLSTQGYSAEYRAEAAMGASRSAQKLDENALSEKYLQLVLTTSGMEKFRAEAQTALMQNHFEKQEYREVIDIFKRSSIKAEGLQEAARLMIAARTYRQLKQPREALNLFREVERLVPPENDLAFQASYYRLLCFFEIEGRHIPDQVDAFLQIYRASRPADERIHTALLMKAGALFANKQNAEAAKVFSEIEASSLSDENRKTLLYQRGWCLAETGDPQGGIRSLSEFIAAYPQDPLIRSAIAKRAMAFAETSEPSKAIADFDKLIASKNKDEFTSFAWLESARMRRAEGNTTDMVARYRGLLENVADLTDKLEGEANYWIGWGMVKTNAAKESVPYLEKARTLSPEAYKKHAGILLALGYFAGQDPPKLIEEINLAIEGKYQDDIPSQAIQWAGMQSYNAGDFESAARFLTLVSNPEEPRETPKEVWRYLAKAELELGKPEPALAAALNVLAQEENAAWKADGLLDRGRALLMLNRPAEARQVADESAALHPQGRTQAGLQILSGDLFMREGDPSRAAAEYLKVVSFSVDADLKPLALHRLIQSHEKKGETAEAEKYRAQLRAEFPNWKEPASPKAE